MCCECIADCVLRVLAAFASLNLHDFFSAQKKNKKKSLGLPVSVVFDNLTMLLIFKVLSNLLALF